MRRLVDGIERDFPDDAEVEIVRLADRLIVKTPEGAHSAIALRVGEAVLVSYRGRQYRIERPGARKEASRPAASGEMRAPMPGQIAEVRAAPGQTVRKGETLVVLEAMKTHLPFVAPFDGIVESLPVSAGDQVEEGAVLVIVRGSSDNDESV